MDLSKVRVNIYKKDGFTFINLGDNEKVIINLHGKSICEIDTTNKTKTINIAGGNKVICTIEYINKRLIKITPRNNKMILNVSAFTTTVISQILLDFIEKLEKNKNDIISRIILKKIVSVTQNLLKRDEVLTKNEKEKKEKDKKEEVAKEIKKIKGDLNDVIKSMQKKQ